MCRILKTPHGTPSSRVVIKALAFAFSLLPLGTLNAGNYTTGGADTIDVGVSTVTVGGGNSITLTDGGFATIDASGGDGTVTVAGESVVVNTGITYTDSSTLTMTANAPIPPKTGGTATIALNVTGGYDQTLDLQRLDDYITSGALNIQSSTTGGIGSANGAAPLQSNGGTAANLKIVLAGLSSSNMQGVKDLNVIINGLTGTDTITTVPSYMRELIFTSISGAATFDLADLNKNDNTAISAGTDPSITQQVRVDGNLAAAPKLANYTGKKVVYTSTEASTNLPVAASTDGGTQNTLEVGDATTAAVLGNISPDGLFSRINLLNGIAGTINTASMSNDTVYSVPVVQLGGTFETIGNLTGHGSNQHVVLVTSPTQRLLPSVASGTFRLVFDTNADSAANLTIPAGYASLEVKSGTLSGNINTTSMSTQALKLQGGLVTGAINMNAGTLSVEDAALVGVPVIASGDNTLEINLLNNGSTTGFTEFKPTAGYKRILLTQGVLSTTSADGQIDTGSMTEPTIEFASSNASVSNGKSILMSNGTIKYSNAGAATSLPTLVGSGNTLDFAGASTNTTNLDDNQIPKEYSNLTLSDDELNFASSKKLDMTKMLPSATLTFAGGTLGSNVNNIDLHGGTVVFDTTTYPTVTLHSDAVTAIGNVPSLRNTYLLKKAPSGSTTLTPTAQFQKVILAPGDAQNFSNLTLNMNTMGDKYLVVSADDTALTAYPAITMSSGTVSMEALNDIPTLTGTGNTLSITASNFANVIKMSSLNAYGNLQVGGTIDGATIEVDGDGSNLAVISGAEGTIKNLTMQISPSSGGQNIAGLSTSVLTDKYTTLEFASANLANFTDDIDMTSMSSRELRLSTSAAYTFATGKALIMREGVLNVVNETALPNVLSAMSAANTTSPQTYGNTLKLSTNLSAGSIDFGHSEAISLIDVGSYNITGATLNYKASATDLPTLGAVGNTLNLDGYEGSVDLTDTASFNAVSFTGGSPKVNMGAVSTFTVKTDADGAPVLTPPSSGSVTLAVDNNAKAKVALAFGPNEAISGLPSFTASNYNADGAFREATLTLAEGYAQAKTVTNVYPDLTTHLQSVSLGVNNTLVVDDSTAVPASGTVTLPIAFSKVEIKNGDFSAVTLATDTVTNYSGQSANFSNLSTGTVFESLTLSNLGVSKVGNVTMAAGGTLALSGDTTVTGNLGVLTASADTTLSFDFDTETEYLVATATTNSAQWTFAGANNVTAECIDVGVDANNNTMYFCRSKDALNAGKEIADELNTRHALRIGRLLHNIQPGQFYPYMNTMGRAHDTVASDPGYGLYQVGGAYSVVFGKSQLLVDFTYENAHVARLTDRSTVSATVGGKVPLLPRVDLQGFTKVGFNSYTREKAVDTNIIQAKSTHLDMLVDASVKAYEYYNDKDYQLYGSLHMVGHFVPGYKQWMYKWQPRATIQVIPEAGMFYDASLKSMPLKVHLYGAYSTLLSGTKHDYSISGVAQTYTQKSSNALTIGTEITALAFASTDVSIHAEYSTDKSYSAGIRFTLHNKPFFSWSNHGTTHNRTFSATSY